MTIPTKEARPSPYRWVVISMLWGLNVIEPITLQSLGVMLPAITQDLSVTPSQAGLLGAAAWLGRALFSIPFSAWLSRYSPRRLVGGAILTAVVLVFLQGLSPAYGFLLASRVALVVVLVAEVPARPLLIQQWFPRREISLVNGIYSALNGTGVATAVVLTPFLLLALGGWRNTLYAYAVLFALGALLWILLAREGRSEEYQSRYLAQKRTPLMAVMKYRELWLLALGQLGGYIAWSARLTFYPTFMLAAYQMPITTSGFILAMHQLGYIVGCFISGIVAEKVGYRRPLIYIPGILMPLFSFGLLVTSWVPLLAFFAVASGLIWLFNPIIHTIPYELPGIKPREVAVASAFVATAMMGGGSLGPLLAGVLYQGLGSLYTALAITCIFPGLYFVTGMLIPETGRRAREATRVTSL